MQRFILVVLGLIVLAGVAAADHRFGKQVRFVGIHPIPKSEGGGICYIEGPHVHTYAANKVEFRNHGDDHYFVGDPVAYGYDGPRYTYQGPHPIHVDAVVGGDSDVEFCYLQGPHYHYFAPPQGNPEFTMRGDAYFYVGQPPQAFVEARPQYIGINDYYRPLAYSRPVVDVEAPDGWIGARAEFVGPSLVVGTPGAVVVDHRGRVVEPGIGVGVGVGISVPMPSVHLGVNIGGPAVIVHDRQPVYIEHDRDYDRHVDEHHHDNGRHEGWHKGR